MKQYLSTLLLLLPLTACASAVSEEGWSGTGGQPFETARTACQQISYGIETNFIRCMAGRGWIRKPAEGER